MNKKYKMLLEIIKKEETENGSISLKESGLFMNAISKITKKYGFNCYVKGYPKEKLNYKLTNKKINIKTVDDISELSEQQFEFFIDDLRSRCSMMKGFKELEKTGLADLQKENGMTWLDTGLHEKIINVKISNKI